MTKPLASKQMVEQKIAELATDIVTDYHDKHPLFVCLLRGAAPFAMKLMIEITRQSPDFHPELDYMMVKTYGDKRTASQPEVVMDLAPATKLSGRDVVILDDVLDSGITADFVAQNLQDRGATSTTIAVLVEKDIARHLTIKADYVAFTAGSEWLAGMGMDDTATALEAYRWHEDILIIN